jgi:hypothetical protein
MDNEDAIRQLDLLGKELFAELEKTRKKHSARGNSDGIPKVDLWIMARYPERLEALELAIKVLGDGGCL